MGGVKLGEAAGAQRPDQGACQNETGDGRPDHDAGRRAESTRHQCAQGAGDDPYKYGHHAWQGLKRMDDFARYAVAASVMAVEDAALPITQDNSRRIGVLLGNNNGGATGNGGDSGTTTGVKVTNKGGLNGLGIYSHNGGGSSATKRRWDPPVERAPLPREDTARGLRPTREQCNIGARAASRGTSA